MRSHCAQPKISSRVGRLGSRYPRKPSTLGTAMKLTLGSIALLLAVACGTAPRPGTAYPSPPTEALAAWQTFPAHQVPRPIVVFWNSFSPAGGFAGDNEKIAGMCSKFVLASPLPVQIPTQAVATWTDGTTATYSAISASEAFSEMTHVAVRMPGRECVSVPALPVTAARFGTAQVKTDRGTATVSSWLFTATGVQGDMAYPALPRSAYWEIRTDKRSSDQGASVSGDARLVTLTFTGAPDNPGPCGADYTAAVAESGSAVAVAVLANPHAAPDAPIACAAIAAERSVTVNLAAPLGGRVVLNAAGDIVTVCPEATVRTSCYPANPRRESQVL